MKNEELCPPAVVAAGGFDIPHSDIPNIRVYDAPDFARVLQQPLEDNKQKFLQIQTCFKSVVFQLLV